MIQLKEIIVVADIVVSLNVMPDWAISHSDRYPCLHDKIRLTIISRPYDIMSS